MVLVPCFQKYPLLKIMGTDFLVFPLERRKANDHTSFYQSLIHIAKLLHISFFPKQTSSDLLIFLLQTLFLASSYTFHAQCCKSCPARAHCHQQSRTTTCFIEKNTVQTYNNAWVICIHLEEEKGKLLGVFRREQCGFEWMSSICLHLKLAN